MGQTARLWAGRIERIDRAGFWRTIKRILSLRARAGRGRNGAYYGGSPAMAKLCPLTTPIKMTPILLSLVWKLLLPALLLVAVADVLTQSQPQRIRRLHRTGLSQRLIASRLGLSRYQVQKALASPLRPPRRPSLSFRFLSHALPSSRFPFRFHAGFRRFCFHLWQADQLCAFCGFCGAFRCAFHALRLWCGGFLCLLRCFPW